ERGGSNGSRRLAVKPHDVVQRDRGRAAVSLDCARDRRRGPAIGDAPSIKPGASPGDVKRVKLRQTEAPRERVRGLIGAIGGKLDHHFVGQIVTTIDRQGPEAWA